MCRSRLTSIASVLFSGVLLLTSNSALSDEEEGTPQPIPVELTIAFEPIEAYGHRSTPEAIKIEGVVGIHFFQEEGTIGFWVHNQGLTEQRIEIDKIAGIGWSYECPDPPPPIEAITGSWAWVEGQRLEIHIDGSFEVFKDGERINSGRWELTDPGKRVYMLYHVGGGWIDTVTLSKDWRSLDGSNQHGYPIHGKRF